MLDPKWAWLSGVFDGEGSVIFRWRNNLVRLGLGVGMCHFEAMETLHDTVKSLGFEPRWSEQRMPSGRIIYRVETTDRRGLRLWAEAMLPYSIVKKEEMEVALSALAIVEGQQYNTADRHRVNEEAFAMVRSCVKHRKFSGVMVNG